MPLGTPHGIAQTPVGKLRVCNVARTLRRDRSGVLPTECRLTQQHCQNLGDIELREVQVRGTSRSLASIWASLWPHIRPSDCRI